MGVWLEECLLTIIIIRYVLSAYVNPPGTYAHFPLRHLRTLNPVGISWGDRMLEVSYIVVEEGGRLIDEVVGASNGPIWEVVLLIEVVL